MPPAEEPLRREPEKGAAALREKDDLRSLAASPLSLVVTVVDDEVVVADEDERVVTALEDWD